METQLDRQQTCDPKKEEHLIISILVAYDEKNIPAHCTAVYE